MLYFRSEAHIDRWCATWRLPRGGTMTLDTGWKLSQAWFGQYRGEPQWRRRTVDEAQGLFASLGLTGDFWQLG